ncbi:hypothetical protein [Kitasatospora brasiliensis]|uniref:hypothetical protein n=1 Tax=Kitasatospora brasiliensis TaxID=3058040 RepID=UPI00293069F3|nr:hypothetical protein [Kitasatospora sp. K002]
MSTNPPARHSIHQAFALREDPDRPGELSVLLISPAHESSLTLPGGPAEQHELPHHAARRHLESSTSLVLPLRTILSIDYTPEALTLIYAGGMLTPQQASIASLHRPVHWVPRHKLRDVTTPDHHHRIEDAWEHGDGLPLLIQGTPVPIG